MALGPDVLDHVRIAVELLQQALARDGVRSAAATHAGR
jgi:hypothetical protein